jgi:hypothetical protein
MMMLYLENLVKQKFASPLGELVIVKNLFCGEPSWEHEMNTYDKSS